MIKKAVLFLILFLTQLSPISASENPWQKFRRTFYEVAQQGSTFSKLLTALTLFDADRQFQRRQAIEAEQPFDELPFGEAEQQVRTFVIAQIHRLATARNLYNQVKDHDFMTLSSLARLVAILAPRGNGEERPNKNLAA